MALYDEEDYRQRVFDAILIELQHIRREQLQMTQLLHQWLLLDALQAKVATEELDKIWADIKRRQWKLQSLGVEDAS